MSLLEVKEGDIARKTWANGSYIVGVVRTVIDGNIHWGKILENKDSPFKGIVTIKPIHKGDYVEKIKNKKLLDKYMVELL